MDGAHLSERGAARGRGTRRELRRRAPRSNVGAQQVRTAVRIRAAESVPDLTDRIMAAVARGSERPARRPLRSAAGPTACGGAGDRCRDRRPPRREPPGRRARGAPHPQTAWASEIEQGVRQAAPSIDAFQGSYTITERGLAPDVPERTLTMDVGVPRAPAVPPRRARRHGLSRRTRGRRRTSPTSRTCPRRTCPGRAAVSARCSRSTARTGTTIARAPYSSAPPRARRPDRPARDARLAWRGYRSSVRRRSTGTTPSRSRCRSRAPVPCSRSCRWAARGARSSPTIAVTVWLDTTGWYPVETQIAPSADPERHDWEMRFGLPREPTGTPILDVSLASVSDARPDAAVVPDPRPRRRLAGRHGAGLRIRARRARRAVAAQPGRGDRSGARAVGTDVGPAVRRRARLPAGRRGPAMVRARTLRTRSASTPNRSSSRPSVLPCTNPPATDSAAVWRSTPPAPTSSSSRTCRATTCSRSPRRSASRRRRCPRDGASSTPAR